MISENQLRSSTIGASKIIHKSSIVNPRSRFVTEETVALLFNISPEQIYRIDCCHNVVYVHAKGLSRFVSSADFRSKTALYSRFCRMVQTLETDTSTRILD